MNHRKYIARRGELTSGAGTAQIIDAANEVLEVDCSDLENIVVYIVQIVDAGTVVIVTEGDAGGGFWEVIDASTAETDFAAGAGVPAAKFTLSDANGMPLPMKKVRARATALAGGGSYALLVCGWQRAGYK